ncbi:MAG TPA: DUF2608 domain-containing protein [Rhabdochlamydiaceae bacterium]|nr:DUF2608 domain-containing protein [Rhabdochlamydiaceae bacterium]
MRNIKAIFLTIILGLTIQAFTEIRTADSLDPIEKELNICGSETLALLDIGDTLLQHKDAVMDKKNDEWKRAWFKEHYPPLSRADYVALVGIVENASENWKLVDPLWPSLIKKAQSKEIKVVAFTKTVVDPSLEGVRSRNLKDHGILLKNELKGFDSGNLYHYDNDGVIETEAPLKGPVLKELIGHFSSHPKKIIFVDDRLEQIQSVDEFCKEAGISCIAFHFTAGKKSVLSFNETVAAYQLKLLVEERRWISESDAQKLLLPKE